MRKSSLILIVAAVVAGVALIATTEHQSHYVPASNQQPVNVVMVIGAIGLPADVPHVNITQVYSGNQAHEWAESDHVGHVFLNDEGVVLDLESDEKLVQAHVGYGNTGDPAYALFSWNGKSQLPPYRPVQAKNGKWYRVPLNNIEVLASSSSHPFPPKEKGTCIGDKMGFSHCT